MKRDVPHFRIGLLLTEAGILAPKQLDEAIQKGENTNVPFLRVLVDTGSLKQHELQAVIRAQSLIWSGLLDVERAIQALSVVHDTNVSIDEGLRTVGWNRPDGAMAETVIATYQKASSVAIAIDRTTCQYCGADLDRMSTLCPFCTGDNTQRVSGKIHIEPAWQRQAERTEGGIRAATPARDPLMMAFFSGMCLAGVGQVVLGQVTKGVFLILLTVAASVLTHGVSSLIIFPLAGLDAYLLAEKLRNGKTVGVWEFF